MTTQQSERIAVYLRPGMREQVAQAVESSGQSQQEWLRAAITEALDPQPKQDPLDETMVVRLEAALTEIRRLEEHLQDARGQRDVANASNERLETLLAQSQATVINMTRALPAAGATSWWQFWR